MCPALCAPELRVEDTVPTYRIWLDEKEELRTALTTIVCLLWPLLDQVWKALDRIEYGLRRRDYRPNYVNSSNQLLQNLSLIRHQLTPVLIETHRLQGRLPHSPFGRLPSDDPPLLPPSPPPGTPDIEQLYDLLNAAGVLSIKLDQGLRNPDTSHHLTPRLVPLVPQIRSHLAQFTQALGLDFDWSS